MDIAFYTIYMLITTIFVASAELEVTVNEVEGIAEGSEGVIACDYTPIDALGVDITWKRVRTQADIETLVLRNTVQEEYKTRMELQVPNNFQGRAGLRIFEVTKDDAMVYSCEIFSDEGSDTKTTRLDVQWNYKPKITSNPDPLRSVQVGDNVTLTCITDANPNPAVTWLMNNETIEVDDRYTINDNTSTLHITGVTRDDHAPVSCSSTNDVKTSISDQIEVDVQYEPEVSLNQTENSVQCVSQANPEAYQFEFEIDEKVVQQGSNVVYELREESGCVNITCFATNKIGTGNASDIACPIYKEPTSLPVTGLSGGAIAGIVIGCLLFIGAAVILVLIILVKHNSGVYKKNDKWEYAKDNDNVSHQTPPAAGTDTGFGTSGAEPSEEKPKEHRYDEPPVVDDKPENKDWV